MSGSVKTQMIYFEVNGTGYAVEAAYLSGVAYSCPFVSYPGLPKGVGGITQWSGKIYPVIPFSANAPIDARSSTFIFTVDDLNGPFHEVAVAVPGQVRVYFAESVENPPADMPHSVVAIVKDKEGVVARVINIRDIKNLIAGKEKGGKIAA